MIHNLEIVQAKQQTGIVMEFLEDSIIVASHPDDEILWFSSVLSKVNKIVFCFLPVDSNPTWTDGRRESLSDYPLQNICCLDLLESEVFGGVDWRRPITMDYGLRITEKHLSDKIYRKNFDTLKERLHEQLQGYKNVFTHNPWGEYGHVEHVQVYRVVKAIQQEMQFNLWFSNYASNKSSYLMASTLFDIRPYSVTLNTNKAQAERIANIYKGNNCWTWYDDYEWCDSETFVKDVGTSSGKQRYGSLLPINLITIEVPPEKQSVLANYVAKFRRISL